MELIVVFIIVACLVGAVWSLSTRGWWIPGTVNVAGALIFFATIPDTDGDVGGIGALAAGLATIAAIVLLVIGVIFFVAGAWVRSRALAAAAAPPAASPLTAELPVATDVSRR